MRSPRSRRRKSTRCWRSARASRAANPPSRRPNSAPRSEIDLSQAEDPRRQQRKDAGRDVTLEDVRQLMGASTPHFALQLRERIAKLIAGLDPAHPARIEG